MAKQRDMHTSREPKFEQSIPVPRTCEHCDKPLGTMSFMYKQEGKTKTGYFHPKCFVVFRKKADLKHSASNVP